MPKATHACYWIVGAAKAPAQTPAVAVDLHDESGDLMGETFTCDLSPAPGPWYDHGIAARSIALAYARKHGVKAGNVTHDTDSTEFFADA